MESPHRQSVTTIEAGLYCRVTKSQTISVWYEVIRVVHITRYLMIMAVVAVYKTCTTVKFSIPSNETRPELDFCPAGLENMIYVRLLVAFAKTCNMSTCF